MIKAGASLIVILASLGMVSSAHAQAPAELVITPPQEFMVTELGDSQTFSVALNSKPSSKVVVSVLSNDTSEGVVDHGELTFLRENWDVPQRVTVMGVDDNIADGTTKFNITASVSYTKDSSYKNAVPQVLLFENLDDEEDTAADITNPFAVVSTAIAKPKKTTIRIMAANTTSGEDQSYDEGEGIRIFKAMKPDIVLIQEFNYNKNSIKILFRVRLEKNMYIHEGRAKFRTGSYRGIQFARAVRGNRTEYRTGSGNGLL